MLWALGLEMLPILLFGAESFAPHALIRLPFFRFAGSYRVSASKQVI